MPMIYVYWVCHPVKCKTYNLWKLFGSDRDIIYNSQKNLTMLFKPKKLKSLPLYLCNNQLDYVDNCRYLDIKIETYSCKSNMKKQLCPFYAKVLIRIFFIFILMMSSCIYLNHTVLICTVHNCGMILLQPLWGTNISKL